MFMLVADLIVSHRTEFQEHNTYKVDLIISGLVYGDKIKKTK
jgi:hypothetical protein